MQAFNESYHVCAGCFEPVPIERECDDCRKYILRSDCLLCQRCDDIPRRVLKAMNSPGCDYCLTIEAMMIEHAGAGVSQAPSYHTSLQCWCDVCQTTGETGATDVGVGWLPPDASRSQMPSSFSTLTTPLTRAFAMALRWMSNPETELLLKCADDRPRWFSLHLKIIGVLRSLCRAVRSFVLRTSAEPEADSNMKLKLKGERTVYTKCTLYTQHW